MSLEVLDITKSFIGGSGEVRNVLTGVSFSAKRQNSVAITGASGAGKSTLLHILGGLEKPDSGSVQFSSLETTRTATSFRPFKLRLGFVFQFHHLMPDLTAAENVAMPLMIRRVSHGKSMAAAVEALAELAIGDLASERIQTLSGGEQQRVAVARALVSRPEIVLADEPTGNLDPANGADLERTLINYAKSNNAILILATHSSDLAAACDVHLRLDAGTVKPFDV